MAPVHTHDFLARPFKYRLFLVFFATYFAHLFSLPFKILERNSGLRYPMGLQRRLRSHALSCSADSEMAVIRVAEFITELQTVEYSYTFKTYEEVPEKLGDVFYAVMYAWDTKRHGSDRGRRHRRGRSY